MRKSRAIAAEKNVWGGSRVMRRGRACACVGLAGWWAVGAMATSTRLQSARSFVPLLAPNTARRMEFDRSTDGATAKLRAARLVHARRDRKPRRRALRRRDGRGQHTATVRMSSASLHLTLYKPRSIRLDVAPFVLLYPTLFSVYLFAYAPSTVLYANFAVPAVVACHLLTFLATHWSLPMRCLLQFRRVKTVADAQYVRVRPSASSGGGRSELCTLEKREAFNTAAADEEEVRFEHRKRTYLFSPPKTAVTDEASCFGELVMPLNLPITYYLNGAKGLRGEALSHATHKYGRNAFAIPPHSFGGLLLEHALAPFFVFQVFCVVLWSLDDYWYYSLFTLVMLVAFESTVVTSRLRNWDEMREMATPPSAALALRDGKWTELSSEDLLPGDIISLARAEGGLAYSYNGATTEVEAVCPADVVLLHGTVTVNESALTGESTPMLKSPIDTVADQTPHTPSSSLNAASATEEGPAPPPKLDITKHKAAVVLGGTRLLQHTSGTTQPSSSQPPGGGAVGYVLRTGFDSTQGELIRTILFASERATGDSKETLVFILILLCFAVCAASYVLIHGLADPTRSRWRLLLHCTMILTSVVPPELPMELSLAVNNSLLALHRLGIYCTEPFRIPFAGRLHTCCFDKTGTLTLSELIVEGIATPLAVTAAHEQQKDGKSKTSATAATTDALPSGVYGVLDAQSCQLHCGYVLAGCHSLIPVEDAGRRFSGGGGGTSKLLGDPMEKEALKAAGWIYQEGGHAMRTLPVDPVQLGHGGEAGGAPNMNAHASEVYCQPRLRILKRFPFSSELKRSSTIVDATIRVGGGSRMAPESSSKLLTSACKSGLAGLLVLAKGSPEVIRPMLSYIPEGYDATYLHYASSGKRILALATKRLGNGKYDSASGDQAASNAAAQKIHRDEVESGLTFCGFLVLHCPPRPESKEMLSALHTSGHALMMLTGDNLLTATHTAHTLGLSRRPALLIEATASSEGKGTTEDIIDASSLLQSVPTPSSLTRTPIERYLGYDRNYAPSRSAPLLPTNTLQLKAWRSSEIDGEPGGGNNKGKAVKALASGLPLFMNDLKPETFRLLSRKYDLCIGGDVFTILQHHNALQAALPHLRVLARMSPTQKEIALSTLRECGLVSLMCGDGTNDVGALKQSEVSVALVTASLVAPPPPPKPLEDSTAFGASSSLRQRKGGSKPGGGGGGGPKERHERKMQERAEALATAMQTTPSVKLGDASIAAAFTARSASPSSCVDVITQGRCTLVTTTQMFKVCVCTAKQQHHHHLNTPHTLTFPPSPLPTPTRSSP